VLRQKATKRRLSLKISISQTAEPVGEATASSQVVKLRKGLQPGAGQERSRKPVRDQIKKGPVSQPGRELRSTGKQGRLSR